MQSQNAFLFVALLTLIVLLVKAEDLTAPEHFQVQFLTTVAPTPVTLNITRTWSPRGVDHFYTLLQANVSYYNDNSFFRVVPNFVAQFGINGDPDVSQKWVNANIPDDPVKLSNLRGTVAYAMSSDPNSRTTQLYVNFKDNSRLDSMGFAPFAVISESDMKILDKIYSGYGEQPDQQQIYEQGNNYLKKNFPRLDYLIKAEIISK